MLNNSLCERLSIQHYHSYKKMHVTDIDKKKRASGLNVDGSDPDSNTIILCKCGLNFEAYIVCSCGDSEFPFYD